MRTILKGFAAALMALLVYVAVEQGGGEPHGVPSASGGAPGIGSAVRGRAHVVDADTLDIAGVRVRLHGIDAPERDQNCTRSGVAWRCGQQASAALAALVAGRDLRCELSDRDRYGRMVGICWLDALDVNGWLVQQGWAVAYRRFSAAYVGAEAVAREARRGIWAGTFTMPEEYRRSQTSAR